MDPFGSLGLWGWLRTANFVGRLVHCWYTVGTVLVDLWRLVHQWFWVFLTIGTVYKSSKTVKRQSNSKKMTIVYKSSCLHRVRRIHKATQTPLPRETSITCAWAVATARRPWTGLTVCVYMDVHASGFLFAAVCCYTLFYLLMMSVARLVCQRPSSNFPYFRTPLTNFLLSRPNSVEYGNSKTTTLLHSAKCTPPLFQGRTGCGGHPSGWHDVVTCQHLVRLAAPFEMVSIEQLGRSTLLCR